MITVVRVTLCLAGSRETDVCDRDDSFRGFNSIPSDWLREVCRDLKIEDCCDEFRVLGRVP